jgi:hypothetical protein
MGRFQNNPSIGWIHPKSTHALMLGAKIENLKSFWNKDTKTGHEQSCVPYISSNVRF